VLHAPHQQVVNRLWLWKGQGTQGRLEQRPDPEQRCNVWSKCMCVCVCEADMAHQGSLNQT